MADTAALRFESMYLQTGHGCHDCGHGNPVLCGWLCVPNVKDAWTDATLEAPAAPTDDAVREAMDFFASRRNRLCDCIALTGGKHYDHPSSAACDTIIAARRLATLAAALADRTAAPSEAYIDVLFDGPPSHESGRFVEVNAPDGRSIKAGEWIERDDGLWALRIFRIVAQDDATPLWEAMGLPAVPPIPAIKRRKT